MDDNKGAAVAYVVLAVVLAVAVTAARNWYHDGNAAPRPSFAASQPDPEGGERTCYTCGGKGRTTCQDCGGRGKVLYAAHGYDFCQRCGGSKISDCYQCKGRGKFHNSSPSVLRK